VIVAEAPTIHASAVLVGARAVLIRGPSASGKSRLALALLEAGAAGRLPFARLVTDDRAHIEAANGRLLIRPPDQLKGLIEIRGLGIRRMPFESPAVAGWIVDLAAPDADRLPQPEAEKAVIAGVELTRLPVAAGTDPLPLVLVALRNNSA
jgi:serine kinase of HPr protein (carbohydrate metabolism regulator)